MKLSPAGLAALQQLEGWRAVVYRDEAGQETIGYGHLLTPEDKLSQRYVRAISREEGGLLLRKDVERFERAVLEAVKHPLVQHQFDALVLLAFNIGVDALKKSRLVARINAHADDAAIEREWLGWKYVTVDGQRVVSAGLFRRRALEVRMWRGGAR